MAGVWKAYGLAGCAAALVAACSSDLFHATSWASRCDTSPSDPACVSTSSATSTGDGGAGGFGGDAVSSSLASTGGAVQASSVATSSASVGGGTQDIGCSDGAREGFTSESQFPNIASCAGGWSVPGLSAPSPACARKGGDDGANPAGQGCSAADLCSTGWHVCASAAEVGAKTGGNNCALALESAAPPAFFATGQSGAGYAMCAAGANDLFGCGSLGGAADPLTCAPLDRTGGDLCILLGAPWACGPVNTDEVTQATKSDASAGGVLCCRD